MNFPVKKGHKYYSYWKPVQNGDSKPDEYQKELVNLVRLALESGIFYSGELREYIKENNDFIPSEAWKLQYENHDVDGGLMGMEIYGARILAEKQIRDDERKSHGFEVLTQDFVDSAFAMKKKVIVFRGKGVKYNARNIAGKNYLMKPYSRNKALAISENVFVKMVD